MVCATIAGEINANLDMVERDERWYETKEPAAISNIASLPSVSIAWVTFSQLLKREVERETRK